MEHLRLAVRQPRESILRDLRGIGYYSSYNERGKYYTLEGIPDFDGFGLWRYRRTYFSARRTTLDTAEYLVNASATGHTHGELRGILHRAPKNTLYQLAMAGRDTQRQHGAQYVYTLGKKRAASSRCWPWDGA